MKILSFNHYWRLAAAYLCYLLFAIGACLPGLYIFALALTPIDSAAKQRKVRDAIQWLCRLYVNIMQFIGLMNYTVEGTRIEGLRGHMVISNHTMLIDAIFALAFAENLCCVVKSQLCVNPFTRVPVRLAGYLANDDPHIVEKASRKLHAGENILIFPEGTRNQYDLQLDFKRGAANIAIMSGAPILPIVLCCMPRALCKGDSWWYLPEVKSRIVMQFKPVLKIEDCIDITQPRTRQYRRLTEWLRDYYLMHVKKVVGSQTN
ncbi:lysophospholipid acyltransferase family protein [Arenicella sp. 4NH20-0111]|uniref:lysophospholipid acyltransferase family protein n=1 Tax=Arenicella sp. 4NH20-0111 TaxID=3127648 RepID=UPI003109EADE